MIYIIDCASTQFFKVGYSTDLLGVFSRVDQMQTGNPFKLQLVQYWPNCDQDMEKEFHVLNQNRCERGEWYKKHKDSFAWAEKELIRIMGLRNPAVWRRCERCGEFFQAPSLGSRRMHPNECRWRKPPKRDPPIRSKLIGRRIDRVY